MKDTRFKELLNLHLDHRLSASESEELEAALREDPARLKALRDYEAMQSACAALFARSESRAPSSAALRRALRQAESRIEHPRAARDAWGWPTWGVTGGLAACVALVVARITQPGLSVANKETENTPAPLPNGPMVAVVAQPAAPSGSAARSVSLPSPITFAALGISSNGANADSASHWILHEDEPAVYATIEQANAAGEAALNAWGASVPAPQQPSVSERHFTGRPINAVGANSGSYQTEAVAYRFER